MQCKKCGNELSGKQLSYCSSRCSKLHLKSLYRKRNPEKVQQWNAAYLAGKGKITPAKRAKALEAASDICLRCGTNQELEVNHIIPVRQGGTHHLKNLIVLCKPCHTLWHDRLGDYWLR